MKETETGKGVDLVITGSMSAVIGSGWRNAHGLVRKMKEAGPDIRIGIIVHGELLRQG